MKKVEREIVQALISKTRKGKIDWNYAHKSNYNIDYESDIFTLHHQATAIDDYYEIIKGYLVHKSSGLSISETSQINYANPNDIPILLQLEREIINHINDSTNESLETTYNNILTEIEEI